ncbi:MAG: dephospho-CoA kinase [Bdellovibrionota bacterium]
MTTKNKITVLALTGGIAAGKSTVAKEFAKLGAKLISSDQLAREVVEPGTEAAEAIRQEFGSHFFDQNGELLRKDLAKKIFSDSEARKKLEKITHPKIRELFQAKVVELTSKSTESQIILYEIPLLFESNIPRNEFDYIISVFTDKAEALNRLVKRDGLDEEQASLRIESQMDPKKKAALSDFIIDNTGDLGDLAAKVTEIFNIIKSEK